MFQLCPHVILIEHFYIHNSSALFLSLFVNKIDSHGELNEQHTFILSVSVCSVNR